MRFLLIVLTLAGCATPQTFLKNLETGEEVVCGGESSGSVMGGMIGYRIQASNAEECVRDYERKGFTRREAYTIVAPR